jgi:hypothetical protein
MAKVRLRSVALGVLLGIALGVLLLPCGTVLYFWVAAGAKGTLPPLTQAEFDAAQKRWRENGPLDYDLRVVLSGSQTGTIHVEVRGGRTTAMTRDGVAPSQRRTWDVWAIPGQFDMIGVELAAASDPEADFGGAKGSQMIVRAEFDPHYGYPRKYQRIILGTPHEITWETTLIVPSPASQ